MLKKSFGFGFVFVLAAFVGVGALSLPPKEPTCQQPKVVGPCEAAIERYFYNGMTCRCEPFTYGGCGGNDNNFESEKACLAMCCNGRPQ